MGEGSPVLVLGGTGHYGRHIVRSLVPRAPVRVLSRNPDRAREQLGEGVEIVAGDVRSREAVARALDGVSALVVSLSAFSPRLIRQLEAIEREAVLAALEAAKAQGVGRALLISVYEARPDLVGGTAAVVARIKLAVEAALARSGLNWTVLGAAPSMEIFFAMVRGETMVVPGGGPPALPTVAPADLGEIAAQAVLREDLSGQRFRLLGPETLSFPEAAARISAVWGRPIAFRAVPLLPIRLAATVTRPFYPYLAYLYGSIQLMNQFPEELVAQAPADHQRLLETFDYRPTTLEMEAERRCDG